MPSLAWGAISNAPITARKPDATRPGMDTTVVATTRLSSSRDVVSGNGPKPTCAPIQAAARITRRHSRKSGTRAAVVYALLTSCSALWQAVHGAPMLPQEEECPVEESLLGELYRASPLGLHALVDSISGDDESYVGPLLLPTLAPFRPRARNCVDL